MAEPGKAGVVRAEQPFFPLGRLAIATEMPDEPRFHTPYVMTSPTTSALVAVPVTATAATAEEDPEQDFCPIVLDILGAAAKVELDVKQPAVVTGLVFLS